MKNIFFIFIISLFVFSASITLSGCGNGVRTIPAGSLSSYKAYTYTVGNGPTGIAVAPDGNVWVTNFYDNTVTELSSQGVTLGTYTVGSGPAGIAVAPDGNVWVADIGSSIIGYSSVTELSPSGNILGYIKYAYNTAGYGSKAVAISPDGNVWVANRGTNTPAGVNDSSVTELSPQGVTLGTYITGGSGPAGIAVAPDGNVWVANFYDNTVTDLSSQGAVIGVYAAGSGSEPNPDGIAVNPSNGNIWISNWGMGNVIGNTVTELSPSGSILGTYTVGSGPAGIAVAPDGNVWVANENSNTVTELVKTANP